MLAGIDLAALGHNSLDYAHVVTEAIKLAFADRERYYGDPRFVDVPIETLLSDAYAEHAARAFAPDESPGRACRPPASIPGLHRTRSASARHDARARRRRARHVVRLRDRSRRQRVLRHAERSLVRHAGDSRHGTVPVVARLAELDRSRAIRRASRPASGRA